MPHRKTGCKFSADYRTRFNKNNNRACTGLSNTWREGTEGEKISRINVNVPEPNEVTAGESTSKSLKLHGCQLYKIEDGSFQNQSEIKLVKVDSQGFGKTVNSLKFCHPTIDDDDNKATEIRFDFKPERRDSKKRSYHRDRHRPNYLRGGADSSLITLKPVGAISGEFVILAAANEERCKSAQSYGRRQSIYNKVKRQKLFRREMRELRSKRMLDEMLYEMTEPLPEYDESELHCWLPPEDFYDYFEPNMFATEDMELQTFSEGTTCIWDTAARNRSQIVERAFWPQRQQASSARGIFCESGGLAPWEWWNVCADSESAWPKAAVLDLAYLTFKTLVHLIYQELSPTEFSLNMRLLPISAPSTDLMVSAENKERSMMKIDNFISLDGEFSKVRHRHVKSMKISKRAGKILSRDVGHNSLLELLPVAGAQKSHEKIASKSYHGGTTPLIIELDSTDEEVEDITKTSIQTKPNEKLTKMDADEVIDVGDDDWVVVSSDEL
ncbi:unnamed protein product [Calicophoron daubneyi]|uniref:Uncharacterized protein n=1 Tax=Calicophoron daubneyi TaxID=300641 RepID=A0AAV2TG93_CALDB